MVDKTQTIANLILTLVVGFLLAWVLLREAVLIIVQHSATQRELIQAAQNHEQRLRALEQKKETQ